MAFRIAAELVEAIIAEAAASPGLEVCGLLLGRGKVIEEVRPCRNVADDPASRFEIDPTALLAAHREARAGGAAILGCYHSHPSGSATPSLRDAAAAEANGWLWLIAAGGTIDAWLAMRPPDPAVGTTFIPAWLAFDPVGQPSGMSDSLPRVAAAQA